MRDEMKAYIKSKEPTFLTEARHKGYVCPVCGNGSGPDGDGITRIRGGNTFHCFKCGLNDDIFGLIGRTFALADFHAQAEKACAWYGLKDDSDTEHYQPRPLKPLPQEDEPEIDHTAEYSKWNAEINKPGNPGLEYLHGRGLSLGTINRFNVGYAPGWKHPKTRHLSKVPLSPRVIIPTSPTSYLARDIRDPEKLSDSERRYTKSKVSRVRIFNVDALANAKDKVFIVEGEIDAMSISEVGGTAIGLGSASNVSAFIDAVRNYRPSSKMVILPDNDEAGISAAEKLKEALTEEGIESSVANIFGKYKDANEMLVKDRKTLQLLVNVLGSKPAFSPASDEDIKAWDETNRTLLGFLNLHDRHRRYLKAKGLSDEQIDRFCYRSAPSSPIEICKALRRKGCSLDRNPWFRKDENGEWTTIFSKSSLIIPTRTLAGKIYGFEEIPDNLEIPELPAPVHFRRGARGISEVVVTGDALQADLVCTLSGYSVLSVPELSSQSYLLPILDSLKERGLKTVSLAFDMDPETRKKTSELRTVLKLTLQMREIICRTRRWDIDKDTRLWNGMHKSLADWLLATKESR